MPKKSRAQVRTETREAAERVTMLRKQQAADAAALKATSAQLRAAVRDRDALVVQSRAAGVDTEEIAADTGLAAGRVRQIAPARDTAGPAEPAVTRRQVVTMIADDAAIADAVRAAAEGRHTSVIGPSRAGKTSGIEVELGASPEGPPQEEVDQEEEDHFRLPDDKDMPKVPRLPELPGRFTIAARVAQALLVHQGDMVHAAAALKTAAIPDAMILLDQSRIGGTYEYTAHSSTPEPLQRPGKRKPNQIWEARPSYVNASTPPGSVVSVLDVNGAYLSALKSVHLPIGRLVRQEDGTLWDRNRSGIYLIHMRAAWPFPHLPDPLGDARESTGPVWVADPTLRLLIRSALAYDLPVPEIISSYTSGASENLLRKFGDALAAARMTAIEEDDDLTLFYVKKIYSKFVSTAGDSRANFEIERPEWVACFRTQAFANLWYKAQKAHQAGLGVHKMLGTDELHLVGDWRAATHMVGGQLRPLFQEGRGLAQIEFKRSYVVGAERA